MDQSENRQGVAMITEGQQDTLVEMDLKEESLQLETCSDTVVDSKTNAVKISHKKRGSVLYKPGANKPRASVAGLVRHDTLSRSKPSAQTHLIGGTTKTQQKKQQSTEMTVQSYIASSRAASRKNSLIPINRAMSPSEIIANLPLVSGSTTVDIRKSRLVKSADPKFISVGPVAQPTQSVSDSVAGEVEEVKSLVVPRKHMSTIVKAKIAAAKWRSFHASKKSEEPEEELKPRLTLNSAPLPRQRCSDVITPTVNGMRIFGISKGGITRAIVKFSEPPPSWPLTVCFHFPSTFLTHRYVLDMVRSKISTIPESRVSTIQFIDRNTIHGTQGLDNRWLVTVSCMEARDALLHKGLHLFNRHIILRPYNEILMAEYQEYLEYISLQKLMYAKMHDNEEADIIPIPID